MLGQGMGPAPYNQLYLLWKQHISLTSDSFGADHHKLVDCLITKLQTITTENAVEGVLSVAMARSLSKIAATLDAPFEIIHHLYVPGKSSFRVDIGLLDSTTDNIQAHSLLETKWENDSNEFPEIEVTSCARSLGANKAIHTNWIPVFVLSRNHFRIGVAYDSAVSRWVYCEIAHHFSIGRLVFGHPEDALDLLRLTKFLFEAAKLHKRWTATSSITPLNLVNSEGMEFMAIEKVVGRRVLFGSRKLDGSGTVALKFYSCHQDGESAIATHLKMCDILSVQSSSTLVKGAAPGLCAIMHDFIDSTPSITNAHLRSLITKVDLLHEKGYVHGDLRLCNIIFHGDGTAHLIDFDWAGKFGEATFPVNVRVKSFDENAAQSVRAGGAIPDYFDLDCLADILKYFGYLHAASAASCRLKAKVIMERLTLSKDDSAHTPLPQATIPYLDLSCLGMRFYARKQEQSKKRPSPSDSVEVGPA